MSLRKVITIALVTVTLGGVLASVSGTLLGFDYAEPFAGASPAVRPEGTLGIAEISVEPTAAVPASGKVARTDERSAAITTPVKRRAVPIPVVKPKPRPTAASSGQSASSAAQNTGGWRSARATWYGPGFYGRRTANGTVLTKDMMNVAHRTLPFGTRIEFEFRGRTAIAVVNDRGPFTPGRVFDLGPGTAKALGFGGVQTVRYRILGR